MGATCSKDKANAFMERTPGAAVLKVFEADCLIVMAHEDDEGEPLHESADSGATAALHA